MNVEASEHTTNHKTKPVKKPTKNEVYVLKDVKDYIGESVLIVFSVLLALFLTEVINNMHEKKQTDELLANIKAELINNKHAEELQYAYQKGVLNRIDSSLNDPGLRQKIISNGEFHLKYLAPAGVSYRDLVRWHGRLPKAVTLQ